jgi:glycosyltransferase involved in cell wall biosynthesis
MKSILLVSGIYAPDIGGPASYIRALASHLSTQNIQVRILTYSSVRSFSGDAAVPYDIHRVWTKIPWGIRHVVFAFRCFFLARHVDEILALNAVSAGVPASWAARLTGKPMIVRIVGDYAWDIGIQTGKTFALINDFQKVAKKGRIGRLHRLQVWTCNRAKAVIVPSEYLAGLVGGWGVAKEKIQVIYNGVDLPVSALSKEDARKQLGISGNIIVSVGRLVPWKGFRMLIKLMPQLLQVNQFFRLVIIGDGPDMRMLQLVVRTLGLERKVTFTGRVPADQLAVHLAAADIFVLNSGYEGFSHQVLESMQAGVPVITTTSGGNREVIVQGENGFMIRYNDEFNLLEAIKTVWRQPELRERMIANGYHTVAAFSVDKMIQQTLVLLEEQQKTS